VEESESFARHRRDFLKWTITMSGGFLATHWVPRSGGLGAATQKSKVAIVAAADRPDGIRRAADLIGWPSANLARVIIKPNCNSAHEFPGSTHITALETVVVELRRRGGKEVVVADRSGMGNTPRVMERKGFDELGRKLNFRVLPLESFRAEEWAHAQLEGSHWSRGVEIPKMFLGSDPIVQLCCLKTHRFGGHITMSLKNSVGMVAKYSVRDGYNYMEELHSSPHQRRMIAEINTLYRPALVIMDAMEAFIDGGPEAGTAVKPGLILASRDRVALDAVGVAILKKFSSPRLTGKIFEVEQLGRAAELNLGVRSTAEIELVAADEASRSAADSLRPILAQG
jgi:uncharacterized protein (DUF362 family)